MSERERELEALHEVAVASSGVLEPDKLGRLVMERARGLLGGDEATLLWYDPEANGLRVLGDTYVHRFPRVVGVGEGTAGIAFERREPVAVEDYPAWEHAVKDALSRGMKSVVAVPLIVRSAPVGALTVSFNQPHQFTEHDLRLLTLLASQIAPALEAARLFDALGRASRHKSQFVANMSHELRTPLNAIIGFSELLSDAREGQFDAATRRRFVSQILGSGRHLLGLINDILDLSKVEAGQMDLKLHAVSVAEVIEQVTMTMETLAARKGITLQVRDDGSGDIVADPGKLKQMLLNLVSNGIKFTPEGGTVTIRTARTPDRLELSVSDTGVGIAEADRHLLFQEFQQIDQGPGRRQEGTGLGLALTRRLARLHGGDISYNSKLGRGSVFTISLPVARPAPAGAPPVHAPADRSSGPLILVVDDDPAGSELLARQLATAGYRTHVVRRGHDAVRIARELQPAAITLDIQLPDLDGWEVMTRLKSDESTSHIPVAVVSVVDNRELGIALGAVDYFVKPVDAKALVKRLSSLQPGARVLVVDDQATNREWLARVLEPAGFGVLRASGGQEAIELAKSQNPDFVVLDLMMPEVNGFEVVEELRADPSTRETPIMVLTAAQLTEADKRQLRGRVSNILSRRSTGAADIVGLVRQLVRAPRTRPV